MKRYIEIQKEVIEDYNMNIDDFDIKNSIYSCKNTFFFIGFYIYKNEDEANYFASLKMKEYELYLI